MIDFHESGGQAWLIFFFFGTDFTDFTVFWFGFLGMELRIPESARFKSESGGQAFLIVVIGDD